MDEKYLNYRLCYIDNVDDWSTFKLYFTSKFKVNGVMTGMIDLLTVMQENLILMKEIYTQFI